MNTPTPAEVGQKLLKLINQASGSKKRHDALILGAVNLRNLNPQQFNAAMFADYLNRKLKKDEGLVFSHQAFGQLFGVAPKAVDVEMLQQELSKQNIALVPLYKLVDNDHLAIFIVIHRQQYRASEYADEMRQILTGKPVQKNPQAWIVGTAIKVSEELGQLIQKAQVVTKYDIVDAINLLKGDELYFISHNFCLMYGIDPLDLSVYLGKKDFNVEKILSQEARDKEENEFYKNFAEVVGIVVSKTEEGIDIGRDNLELLFKVSEEIDRSLPEIHPNEPRTLQ